MKLGLGIIKNRIAGSKADRHHHTHITRPESGELSFFGECMKNLRERNKNARILIIGSSPELRGMAAKMKIHVTVAANDLEVIERASRHMDVKNKSEEWLEGDIMRLPLRKAGFDMVLGDHIMSNAAPFNDEKFYGHMKEILKSGGSAVIRSIIINKSVKPFEKCISRHFDIVEKKFAKEGTFSEYFPIYSLKPK